MFRSGHDDHISYPQLSVTRLSLVYELFHLHPPNDVKYLRGEEIPRNSLQCANHKRNHLICYLVSFYNFSCQVLVRLYSRLFRLHDVCIPRYCKPHQALFMLALVHKFLGRFLSKRLPYYMRFTCLLLSKDRHVCT